MWSIVTGYNAFLRIASRSLAVLASFDLQTGSNFVHWFWLNKQEFKIMYCILTVSITNVLKPTTSNSFLLRQVNTDNLQTSSPHHKPPLDDFKYWHQGATSVENMRQIALWHNNHLKDVDKCVWGKRNCLFSYGRLWLRCSLHGFDVYSMQECLGLGRKVAGRWVGRQVV